MEEQLSLLDLVLNASFTVQLVMTILLLGILLASSAEIGVYRVAAQIAVVRVSSMSASMRW